MSPGINGLTHWGRVTHICVGKLVIIGSDNGLSPGRRQAIIWTNAGLLSIGTLETNFSEIPIELQTFSFKKMHLKMSSGKWRPFCLGLNVLILIHHPDLVISVGPGNCAYRPGPYALDPGIYSWTPWVLTSVKSKRKDTYFLSIKISQKCRQWDLIILPVILSKWSWWKSGFLSWSSRVAVVDRDSCLSMRRCPHDGFNKISLTRCNGTRVGWLHLLKSIESGYVIRRATRWACRGPSHILSIL